MKPIGRYGHHRDEDAPTTVKVIRRLWIEDDVPMPECLARQRRQINDMASRGYIR